MTKAALKRQAFAYMASLIRGAIEGGQLGTWGEANGLTDDEIIELETVIRNEAEKMYNRSLTPAQRKAENADCEPDFPLYLEYENLY